MIIDVVQKKKDLFGAEFAIEHQGNSIGRMRLTGSIASMDGHWDIELDGRHIAMERGKGRIPKELRPFRPYEITMGQKELGAVYQTEEKVGWFRSCGFSQMYLMGQCYNKYGIGLGHEGGKNPIYKGKVQVAQINTPTVIYDDLHRYHILTQDDEILAPILFSAYMYVVGGYKPGVKILTGVSKTITITKDKMLLAKYDPSFEASFDEQRSDREPNRKDVQE